MQESNFLSVRAHLWPPPPFSRRLAGGVMCVTQFFWGLETFLFPPPISQQLDGERREGGLMGSLSHRGAAQFHKFIIVCFIPYNQPHKKQIKTNSKERI